TDVWALGCLLYAMAFGKSPFFTEETGSSALAVLSATIEYPDDHPYSNQFISLIKFLLQSKLKHRPFIPAIIERIDQILNNNNNNNNNNINQTNTTTTSNSKESLIQKSEKY